MNFTKKIIFTFLVSFTIITSLFTAVGYESAIKTLNFLFPRATIYINGVRFYENDI